MNTHEPHQWWSAFRAHNPAREPAGTRRRRPSLECLKSRRLLASIVQWPLLMERELTAGTGKRKHVVGLEVAFSQSRDPALAQDIAERFTQSAGQPVSLGLVSGSSRGSVGMNLAGNAQLAPGTLIVVVARA